MTRKVAVLAPVPGVYKNGTRYWLRTVFSPISHVQRALSTGTNDVVRANAIAAMRDVMEKNPTQWPWLDAALSGDITLDRLYTHHAAGTLDVLREQLAAAKISAADADLRPWVDEWVKKHLSTAKDITDETKATYERQVRVVIPPNVALPKSCFTEDYIKGKLDAVVGARLDKAAPISGSTMRRYLVPLGLFIRYAKKRVPLDVDPLAEIDWRPANGSPRSIFHEFDKIGTVLSHMEGEHKRAMSLIYGSGIELGAFLDMTAADVGKTLDDGRGLIVAPGSKNDHRKERTIFVDKWAWPAVLEQAKHKLPRAPLWSYNPKNEGRELRTAFYLAQVAAGFIAEPEISKTTGKKAWGTVVPHTIHDARHSYCINRSLGLDGEEPQDASFCANQLGHADETMVLKIYKKANVKERLRLIHMQQAQKAARAAGAM